MGAQSDLAAMERLLTRYRRPLLLEIQSRVGCHTNDAEELTQEFIRTCLRRDFLKNIDPRKGRFRSFIKKCIVNFLRDVHRKKVAEPEQHSLDETDADGQPLLEPTGEISAPEMALDSQWARQVLNLSLERLEQECVAARWGSRFSRLKGFLHTDPEGDSYQAVADDFRMNEGAVRTAVHRMRHRLGGIIKEEIMQTVATEKELQDELRYFLELLGKNPG
jgi:RNA polymerase sigma factor (sigma-70 family)